MDDAYQTWHCGNDDCDGAELDDTMQCPECGRQYLSDGTLVQE